MGCKSRLSIASILRFQPKGVHLVNYLPRAASLSPFFEQLHGVGDGLIKRYFDFAGLEKDFLLVTEQGVGELYSSIWTLFL